jgi:hypothetical protein
MARTTFDRLEQNWNILYRVGTVAALLAVFVFRRNLGAELMAFNGFGIFSVPATMPVSAAQWFSLFQNNPFVGLALLEVFDLAEYALVGLIFLALCVTLWHSNRAIMLIATICGLAGIVIYFASNQAFGMFSLSAHYAAATTDAQRVMFLAAGESLLAVNNPGTLYQGTGIYASVFLVLLAGLMISMAMLQSNTFSRITAVTGILANGFGLTYYIVLVFAPALLVLPFVISAPFRVTWYFLIARKLLQLGKSEQHELDPPIDGI